MTTAERKTETFQEMGTTDLLLTVLAAVSLKLPSGQRGIPIDKIYNALRKLKSEKAHPALAHIDFRREGDVWVSRVINDFLFLSGTWGLHRVENPHLSYISIDRVDAEARLNRIKTEFGEQAEKTTEDIASRFEAVLAS